jgi:hypothetical protein
MPVFASQHFLTLGNLAVLASTKDKNILPSIPAGTQINLQIILNNPNGSSQGQTQSVTSTFIPTNSAIAPMVSTISLSGGYRNCDNLANCFLADWSFTPASSGILNIHYAGSPSVPATDFSRPIDIWTPQARSTKDMPDKKSGFQVHAVYVLPNDGTDNGRDTSGQISTWLTQGIRWLDREAGDHWQVDTYRGVPDVTFFQSQYSTVVLSNSNSDAANLLLAEMGLRAPNGSNRKTYIFFIETPVLTINSNDPAYSSGELCGLSGAEVNRAVIVAMGVANTSNGCSGFVDGLDFQAQTALHETIHSFGITHVATPTDIMLKIAEASSTVTLDSPHTQYFKGSAISGIDLTKLRIWSKAPTSTSANWSCIYEDGTAHYLCGLGTSKHVNGYLAQCWQKTSGTMVIQVKSGSKWVNTSKAIPMKLDTCSAKYPIGYQTTFVSAVPTTKIYRFTMPRWVSKQFSVTYQF